MRSAGLILTEADVTKIIDEVETEGRQWINALVIILMTYVTW